MIFHDCLHTLQLSLYTLQSVNILYQIIQNYYSIVLYEVIYVHTNILLESFIYIYNNVSLTFRKIFIYNNKKVMIQEKYKILNQKQIYINDINIDFYNFLQMTF